MSIRPVTEHDRRLLRGGATTAVLLRVRNDLSSPTSIALEFRDDEGRFFLRLHVDDMGDLFKTVGVRDFNELRGVPLLVGRLSGPDEVHETPGLALRAYGGWFVEHFLRPGQSCSLPGTVVDIPTVTKET